MTRSPGPFPGGRVPPAPFHAGPSRTPRLGVPSLLRFQPLLGHRGKAALGRGVRGDRSETWLSPCGKISPRCFPSRIASPRTVGVRVLIMRIRADSLVAIDTGSARGSRVFTLGPEAQLTRGYRGRWGHCDALISVSVSGTNSEPYTLAQLTVVVVFN